VCYLITLKHVKTTEQSFCYYYDRVITIVDFRYIYCSIHVCVCVCVCVFYIVSGDRREKLLVQEEL